MSFHSVIQFRYTPHQELLEIRLGDLLFCYQNGTIKYCNQGQFYEIIAFYENKFSFQVNETIFSEVYVGHTHCVIPFLLSFIEKANGEKSYFHWFSSYYDRINIRFEGNYFEITCENADYQRFTIDYNPHRGYFMYPIRSENYLITLCTIKNQHIEVHYTDKKNKYIHRWELHLPHSLQKLVEILLQIAFN